MPEESLAGKTCCPTGICGDYCKKLTPEQRLLDKRCYVNPPD